MIRFFATLMMLFAYGPLSHGDVPPEILREELGEFMSIMGLDNPVEPDSEEHRATLADPWLGYRVIALVDKSAQGTSPTAQQVFVFLHNGETKQFEHFGTWKTSTGLETPYYRNGKRISSRTTPVGFFRLEFMQWDYVSIKYGEPMPYALFYWRSGGYALHATSSGRYQFLGQRASMGCSRLTYDTAKLLFETVERYGQGTVAKLDRLTGNLMRDKSGPVVLKSYPLFVLNTAPGEKSSPIKVDPSIYVERPEALIELFQSGR